MSRYMVVLILSGSVPFLMSFWPALKFYRNPRPLFDTIILVLLVFGGWDVVATHRGHWSFNPQDVWNLRVINLPLEEVLFFVVIPFCCIFTWESLGFIKSKIKDRKSKMKKEKA